jgi:N-acylglucosamine 2-epimerase
MRENYQKVHDYSFATFPNPDSAIGEWIQIRDRYGRPRDKVVALPVKDPFHIIRNFLLIIELLQSITRDIKYLLP